MPKNKTPSQNGFTYIELLIALSIGLLIIAAVLQVLYNNAGSVKRQSAHADLQDTMVFSTNFVKKQIRKAGMGAKANHQHSGHILKQDTVYGGIVMTAPDQAFGSIDNTVSTNLYGIRLGNAAVPKRLLSRSAVGSSNVLQQKSDQLTILYLMPNGGHYDCQGRGIPKGYYVIERYFVRKDKNATALACASSNFKAVAKRMEDITQWVDISVYTKPNGKTVKSYFSGKGSVIIPNVDYFRVMYGVRDMDKDSQANEDAVDTIEYIAANSAEQAQGFDGQDKRIVSVRFGLLMHSQINQVNAFKKQLPHPQDRFKVLDKQNLMLNTKQDMGNFNRQVLESTILLRNARAIY